MRRYYINKVKDAYKQTAIDLLLGNSITEDLSALRSVRSTGSLIATTVVTCISTNVLAADQFADAIQDAPANTIQSPPPTITQPKSIQQPEEITIHPTGDVAFAPRSSKRHIKKPDWYGNNTMSMIQQTDETTGSDIASEKPGEN